MKTPPSSSRTRLVRVLPLATLVLLAQACSPPAPSLPSSFQEAAEQARGSSVRFFHWGGSDTINRWLDTVLAPALLERHDVRLERVAMEASAFVEKLSAEKAAGKTTGSIDLVWINGENFARAKAGGLLRGPFTQLLPAFAAGVNPETAALDFGTPTEGHESPWGRAQFVFEADRARVPVPPTDLAALSAWIKSNPGRFTWPELPDFTGSAFLRQTMVGLARAAGDKGPWTMDDYPALSERLFAWLDEVRPYLWKEGKTWPRSPAELDQLFARGEVDFNMNYSQSHAQNKIDEGLYPDTVYTFVLSEGSLANTHFVAIPFNAPNTAAALVLANLLLEPELQASKADPAQWGDFPVLDPALLGPEKSAVLEGLARGPAILDLETLAASALSELSPEFVTALEKDWKSRVIEAP